MLLRFCRRRLIWPNSAWAREVGAPTSASDRSKRVGKASVVSNSAQRPGPSGRDLPEQAYAQHLASSQPHRSIRTSVHGYPALLNQARPLHKITLL
jgi:hypothetical protein